MMDIYEYSTATPDTRTQIHPPICFPEPTDLDQHKDVEVRRSEWFRFVVLIAFNGSDAGLPPDYVPAHRWVPISCSRVERDSASSLRWTRGRRALAPPLASPGILLFVGNSLGEANAGGDGVRDRRKVEWSPARVKEDGDGRDVSMLERTSPGYPR